MVILGAVGFLVLIFLPGAWVTFGLGLPGVPGWARCALGAVLSPLVAGAQFYALRLLGVSFDDTAVLLVVLNLPALVLTWRGLRREARPDRGTIVACTVVLAVAAASFAPRLADVQDRSYTGHAWMHADVIYQLADGALVPEDSTLAGLRLSNAWGGHVYQAVLSRILGTAPVENWIWSSLATLAMTCALTAGLAGELGGGASARAAAIAALLFGTNIVGWAGMEVSRLAGWERLLPQGVHETQSIWGDPRYTPWALKFLFFNQMTLGLGMVGGLLYLGARPWAERGEAGRLVVVALLLAGVGVIYPILFPAAAAVAGAAAIAAVAARADAGPPDWPRAAALLGVVGIAGAACHAHLEFVTTDRVARALSMSDLRLAAAKIAAGAVATLPLLVGTALVLRRSWNTRRAATVVLALSAAASFAVHATFHIAYWMNEYKFIFTAAMGLAPFAGVAMGRALERTGRGRAMVLLAAITALAAFPLARASWTEGPWGVPPEIRPVRAAPPDRPRLDVRGFDVRLADRPALDRLAAAVRERTPARTVVVADRAEVHYPTLLQRALYAPPPEERSHYGINRPADYLIVRVRGYSRRILTERLGTVRELFEGPEDSARDLALSRIRELGRPVAIVLQDARQAAAIAWLEARGEGRAVHQADGVTVWLMEPVRAGE